MIDKQWYGPYGARPGVERPDEDIRSEIISAMESDSWVDPSSIILQVENGIVELSGEVDSEEAKRAVSDDAWSIPGVVDVHNELLIEGA